MAVSNGDQRGREKETVALEEAIAVGRERLTRTWPELLATGLVAGIDVSLGVLALLFVEQETGSRMLGALAFSTGFIALILGKTELFDENYLVPVAAVVADRPGVGPLARLWIGMAASNLVGCWIFAGLTAAALSPLAPTAVKVATFYPERGITWESFALGALGGAVITLMTWMEHGSPTQFGRIVAAILAGFILAGAPLNHVIVMSAEMFTALHMGAPFGYADWAGMAAWVAVTNMAGGLLLVTLLRLLQVRAGQREGPVAGEE
ncbi:MAG: formate/nitrite transporter family protein [Actinomycetota bacterium]|nr:formate/nitrite transporter family protein [Actinomycetota bacterium]